MVLCHGVATDDRIEGPGHVGKERIIAHNRVVTARYIARVFVEIVTARNAASPGDSDQLISHQM